MRTIASRRIRLPNNVSLVELQFHTRYPLLLALLSNGAVQSFSYAGKSKDGTAQLLPAHVELDDVRALEMEQRAEGARGGISTPATLSAAKRSSTHKKGSAQIASAHLRPIGFRFHPRLNFLTFLYAESGSSASSTASSSSSVSQLKKRVHLHTIFALVEADGQHTALPCVTQVRQRRRRRDNKEARRRRRRRRKKKQETRRRNKNT